MWDRRSAIHPMSDLYIYPASVHYCFVRLHRHHARRPHALAGANVEHALMEIAFNQVAVDEALGQGTGTVRAGVVGHAELAVEVEDGDGQTGGVDFAHLSRSHLLDLAQFDPRRHNPVQYTRPLKVRPLTA